MSDIGFDVRGYCERLAKACPDRFVDVSDCGDANWAYRDIQRTGKRGLIADFMGPTYIIEADLWAFFGPLADERKIEDIRPWDIITKQCDYRFPTLLEEIIHDVVKSFESEARP